MDRIKYLKAIEKLIEEARKDMWCNHHTFADAELNNALQIIAMMIEEEREN